MKTAPLTRATEKPALPRVLVAGIPASGKSTYCAWLEREKGFLHLDIDELGKDKGTDKQLALRDCLRHSVERFLKAIAPMDQPIVLDWGFPIALLGLVTCLHANGFALWWFDGDRNAARESFIRRGTVSLEAFNTQIKSIEENWPSIKDLIEGNVIHAVSAGPEYLPPELIYSTMCRRKLGWPPVLLALRP